MSLTQSWATMQRYTEYWKSRLHIIQVKLSPFEILKVSMKMNWNTICIWHHGMLEIFFIRSRKSIVSGTVLNYVLDEHAPFKKLRVRAQDVPYMTSEWKRAIRNKSKFSKQFSKKRIQLNLELTNKWRNEATKLRSKLIKSYWQKVCNNLNSNPKQFYKWHI